MSEKNLKYFLCIGFFVVAPLVMTDGYSNITVTKFTVIGILTISCFFWMLLLRYFDIVAQGCKITSSIKQKYHMGFVEFSLSIYLLANLITCIVSGNIAYDIVAVSDKRMGLFYVLLTLMLYSAVRFIKWNEQAELISFIRIAAIGTCLTIIFAFIQFLGIDIANLISNLAGEEKGNFLSTLGNTAVFGKYCCLVCPVLIYGLGDNISRNRSGKSKTLLADKVLFAVLCALYFVSIVVSNIDAAFLGFGIAIVSLFLLSLHQKKLQVFFDFLICGTMGILSFAIIYQVAPFARHLSRFGKAIVDGIFLELVFLVILILIKLWIGKKYHLSDDARKRLFVAGGIAVVSVIALAVSSFIYFSLINRTCNIGFAERYLRFNDSWGTERGIVWKWCMNLFSNLPVMNQMFGAGHGMVPQLLMEKYRTQMFNELKYVFDNAHNVYLHQLISIGVVGTVSYLAVIVSSIVKGLKNKKTAILSIGIIICAVMDVVCIYEPITNPYLWIFIGAVCIGDASKKA